MVITATDLVILTLEDLLMEATEAVSAFGKGSDANTSFNLGAEQVFKKVDTGEVELIDFLDAAKHNPQIKALLDF